MYLNTVYLRALTYHSNGFITTSIFRCVYKYQYRFFFIITTKEPAGLKRALA